VPRDLSVLLNAALRAGAGSGAHAETARQVVLFVIFAQLLAAARHDERPRLVQRPPERLPARRSRRPHVESLSGRRPRG
jgi:hypothetical protein